MLIYTGFLFLVFFFAFRYWKLLNTGTLNAWLLPLAFLIKVIVGFYFLYVYSEIYGNGSLSADAGAFMSESKILNSIFYTNPADYFKLLFGYGDQTQLIAQYLTETHHWDAGEQSIINDNRNIMRIHSVIHFISFNNPAIHLFFMCFVSTIALKQLFLGFVNRTTLPQTLLFFIILFVPSLLFWTAGILKEPFMFLGIALFIRGLLGSERTTLRWVYVALGIILLLSFKPYILLALLPALLFYGLYTLLPKFKILGAGLILLGLLSAGIFIFQNETDKAVHLLSRKQFDFKNVGRGGVHAYADTCFYFFTPEQINELIFEGDSVSISKPMNAMILEHGSMKEPVPIRLEPTGEKWFVFFENRRSDGYIEVTLINNSFPQLLKNIPEALCNVLLRPFFNDPGSWLKYPAIIELILLYLFIIFAFMRRKKLTSSDVGLIIAALIFMIGLSLIIGWVTPVLGAIVRYRIPVLIAVLLIGIILIDYQRVKNESAR